MFNKFFGVIFAALIPTPLVAHDFGLAGLLSKSNVEKLPDITLSVGQPLAESELIIKSGRAYELVIESDGSAELGLDGPGFFRAIWANEVVVNDLEIRPFGLSSLEFDDEGRMEIEFVAIQPGRYFLRIPGTDHDAQKIVIVIE
jgi:hypothetical protein